MASKVDHGSASKNDQGMLDVLWTLKLIVVADDAAMRADRTIGPADRLRRCHWYLSEMSA
jgi:hypothetical protein